MRFLGMRFHGSQYLPLLFGLAVLVSLLGCADSGMLVRSDYDKRAAFAEFHTFGFPANTGTDRGGYTTLVTTYFKDAVQREMTARGYTYSASNPDLLVNFYSESRQRISAYSRPMSTFDAAVGYAPLYRYRGGRYAYPYYGWYAPWPMFEPDIQTYETETGSIKLDLVDANRQRSIWEARVEQPLSEAAKNSPQPFIDDVISAMFRKFPVPSNAGK